MSGKWDNNLKRLVTANPQEFIGWLVEGAVVVRELSVELNRDIYIDILYETILREKIVLVHIEFQRYEEEDMARRVLEYNVFATTKFDRPVLSFVIYLKKEGRIAESPLVKSVPGFAEIWRFNFTNVELWKIPTEKFRQIQSAGILPLLALTSEGGRPDVVNEALDGIERASLDRNVKENLLTIAFALARLALSKPEDQDWLIKRFNMYRDIIKDTEIYQIILQEGREEGVEAFHRVILLSIKDRFPELAEQAAEQVKAITDLDELQKLTLGIISAKSADQMSALLYGLQKTQEH